MTRAALLSVVLAVGCSSPPPPKPVEVPPDAGAEPMADTADAGPSIDDLRLAAFTKVIQETDGLRHECWARGAADDYKLSGRVVLAVTLGANGTPSEVKIDQDTTGDAVLTQCLVDRYKQHPWPPVFEPGTTVKAPFEFSAPDAVFTVAQDHLQPEELDAGKLLTWNLLTSVNTGMNPKLSLRAHELNGDYRINRAPALGATDVFFVAAGEGTLYGSHTARKGVKLATGDIVTVTASATSPGEAFSIGQSGESLQLLELTILGGEESGKKSKPRAARKLKLLHTAKVAKTPIAGGKGWVQLTADKAATGSGAAYAGVIHLDNGVAVPRHIHADSSEILYIYNGTGTMTVGDRDYPVAAPIAVQVPPGVEHAFVATSDVEAVQFYTPAGPEQRFKAPPK